MTDAERYRLAWLSAKQGRKNWQKLYEYAQGKWWLLDKQAISRPYHDLMMRAYRKELAHTEARLEEADLIRTTLQDDHVTAWGRVRELEAELADLRLAFSELQGTQQPKGKTVDEGKKQASLREVSELGGDILVAQHKQLRAAVEARAQGATYAELGDALGVTWQAARQRVLKFIAVEGGNGETE